MLIRMYQNVGAENGYTATVLDSLPAGDEAGIKSCTIEIDGLNALHGYLKAEKAYTVL